MLLLRPATLADADLLAAWDEQPHVRFATGDDGACDWTQELSSTEPWPVVLIAEADGRPIGVVQVIDPRQESTHYWGDCAPHLRAIDIWIGPADALGRGWGTLMLRQAIDLCFAEAEVVAIVIDPLERNVRARRFYERLGFAVVGARRFGTDDCMVYRLDRPTWEARSSGSPASEDDG